MTITSACDGPHSKNRNPACPNSSGDGHTSTTIPSARLTPAQVKSAIATIDIGQGSRLARCASYRAFTADIDADDLLQEAIVRALTTRSCPATIAIEHFLMGVMRSIASKVIESRERADEALLEYSRAYPSTSLTPDERLAHNERADTCRRSIEMVVAGSPATEAVIDGIDHGLCGKALADFAGVDQIELATVRRKIKRRVADVFDDLLADLDEAA